MPAPAASLSPAAIALNRFGLGARPDDAVPADPARSIVQQFDRFDPRPARYAALADAGELVDRYRAQQQATRKAGAGNGAVTGAPAAASADAKAMLKVARQDYRQDVQALYNEGVRARADAALATEAPFVERMVHFWSNHFCVSADNAPVTAFAAAFERDAIRPHVLGRFSDMLLAVEQHPAMLIYLNQVQSIGPDSPAALRGAARNPLRKRGLNENLGREIMELHTLGVRSGYTQADVTEFARALTGWSVDGISGAGKGGGAGKAIRTASSFARTSTNPAPARSSANAIRKTARNRHARRWRTSRMRLRPRRMSRPSSRAILPVTIRRPR